MKWLRMQYCLAWYRHINHNDSGGFFLCSQRLFEKFTRMHGPVEDIDNVYGILFKQYH